MNARKLIQGTSLSLTVVLAIVGCSASSDGDERDPGSTEEGLLAPKEAGAVACVEKSWSAQRTCETACKDALGLTLRDVFDTSTKSGSCCGSGCCASSAAQSLGGSGTTTYTDEVFYDGRDVETTCTKTCRTQVTKCG